MLKRSTLLAWNQFCDKLDNYILTLTNLHTNTATTEYKDGQSSQEW